MIIYDILAAIDDIKFGVMAVDCVDGSVASGNIDMSINILKNFTYVLSQLQERIIEVSYSPTHSLTYSLTYSLTHLLTHSPTHSPTHSLTCLLTHSRIGSIVFDLAYPEYDSFTGLSRVTRSAP